MSKKKAPADFVKFLQSQLKAFRARRFEKLDVEVLGDELEGIVGRYRFEVRERAKRLIEILMKREYVYGDWTDLYGEWDMLSEAIKDSPSLAKTTPAQIKRAYESARLAAELHSISDLDGEEAWPTKCPWPTLDALRRAVKVRYREYLTIEREVGWDPWGRMSLADRAAYAQSRFRGRIAQPGLRKRTAAPEAIPSDG